jgi:hypothetical protein
MKAKRTFRPIATASLALLCAMTFSLRAATYFVTSTSDSGPGSLRALLGFVSDGDVIDLSGVPGTIVLTSGELLVLTSVTLLGPESGTTAVSGNRVTRVFNVTGTNVTFSGLKILNGNTTLNGAGIYAGGPVGTLTLNNCVVTNNNRSGSGGWGGGICNDKGRTLIVNNSIICSNAADYGGGIFNNAISSNATVIISASTLSSNTAWHRGGGIFNYGYSSGKATLTVNASTLRGNWAGEIGGGVFNDGSTSGSATMTNTDCIWSANTAPYGGAIYNYGSGSGRATLTINGGVMCSNSVTGHGGGIYNDGRGSLGATVCISNCLLSANRATSWGGFIYSDTSGGGQAKLNLNACTFSNNWAGVNGGGIENYGPSSGNGALAITNCQFYGNQANTVGGAIHNYGASGTAAMTMDGCTLSGNVANNGGAVYNDGQSSGTMTVAIYDSTLSGNSATNSGGAIYNNGEANGNVTMTVSNCVISGNWATSWAGGIYNDGVNGHATVTFSASTLTNNWSAKAGGILNSGASSGHATMTLCASTFDNNSAVGDGGAIYNSGYQSGSAVLTNIGCTFSGNSAGTNGGAIFNDGRVSGYAAVVVTNTTLTGNSADAGGAIFNFGTLISLNSRFTNNIAQGADGQTPGLNSNGGGGGGAAGMGGAIFSDGVALSLNNAVFSGNQAVGGKGGNGMGNSGSSGDAGGKGGGFNGGLGGAVGYPGNSGGFAGGGGGGAGSYNTGSYPGGAGGFGGGGGGGGARGQSNSGGLGGVGGAYGGNGADALYSTSGGGGGGAGLGGAVFANSGTITVLGCTFTGNLATNGLAGAAYYGYPGQGVGGGLFSVVPSVVVQNSTFTNNLASTYASDMTWPFLVSSLADSGPGSLRQVLASATNGVTINFGVSGTITLTSGPLNVTTNVTLFGPGSALLTVSGNNSSGVFNVTGTNVTIRGLTIANGYNGFATAAAGINAAGSPGSRITLYNCVVTNNNNIGYDGGGIFNSPGVTMVLSNCTVCGNSASNTFGGGICNRQGVLSLVGSTFSGNAASKGGAIYNDGASSSATLTMAGCTISGNAAAIWGGGVFNDGSSSPATNKINSSTFSGNSASQGGAVFNYGPAAKANVEIGDTILSVGAGGAISSSSGTVKSDGYNLSSDAAGGDGTTGPGGLLNGTNDIRNTNPLLGPLQDNGGPTWTHALLPNSPAIDKGKANAITNLVLTADQRGQPRSVNLPSYPSVPGGDGSDIGAYELQVDVIALARPGFYTNGGGWALNGDPAYGGPPNITNNVCTLTDAGVINEHRSAWFPYPLYVGGFQASFTYQDMNGLSTDGDGVAFVLQNDPLGTAALGVAGGGLGYAGITNSAAVLLNIYSGAPGGRGLMLGTNGIGAYDRYQTTAPVALNGGHPIAVSLRYADGILYVSLTDTVTAAQFQTNIPVDIPAFVGMDTAWVGFTGASGGATSRQIVSNFSYRPLPELTIQRSQPGSMVFTWPASVYGFGLQSNPGLNNPAGWTSVAGTITQIGDLNQVTIPSPTGTRFYRLVLPGNP